MIRRREIIAAKGSNHLCMFFVLINFEITSL